VSKGAKMMDQAARVVEEALKGPDRFNDWLAAHKPRELVGFSGIPKCCPAARYLNSRLQAAGLDVEASVSPRIGLIAAETDFRVAFESDRYTTLTEPRWLGWFVRNVDTRRAKTNRVTAQAALRALAKAKGAP
jgi:hypothetical protein